MLGETWKDPIDITKEQWMFLLGEKDIITENDVQLLELIYAYDDYKATAAQLAQALHMPHHAPLNSQVGRLGKRIAKELNIQVPVYHHPKDGQEYNWWHVLFLGEACKEGFYWILRPELQEAMQKLTEIEARI